MTTVLDLTTATPVEIDAVWLETVMAPRNALYRERYEFLKTAEKYERGGSNYAKTAASYRDRAEALGEKIKAFEPLEAPFLAEWKSRGGWSRAYLVPDGHIHKTTACHSLYPTTLISWLPELSGHEEDEIVATAGAMACTFCYPSAPVEAIRAAELAEKAKGECPGSRSFDFERATWRRTSYTGSGRAVCNHCGESISTSTAGRMKVHKRKESVT